MVSTPTYDPENRPDIENDETGQYDGVFLNKVLSASMTPGSTFKIITCAAAIDNIPDINERVFTCSGEIEVDGGVNAETAKVCREAGACLLVAGSYLFSKEDYAAALQTLVK